MLLNQFYVDDLIKRALQEDINYLDVTTDYLLGLTDVKQPYPPAQK